jgi:hypothetical protein
VSGVEIEPKFPAADARRARRSLPKDLDPELRERAMTLLAKINDPPPMAKLREATRRDGVPLTEADYDLLARVRKVRNDTVHGRGADVPESGDVDHVVSIVARLLMFRLARPA